MKSEAAQRLLDADPNRPEDGIRQDISRFLDELQIENELSYRTKAGPSDIFLPNRRVFIEVKKVGLADDPHKAQSRDNLETPFQQVERYLRAEIVRDLERLPFGDQPDLPWTGIVTDGCVWHAWRFQNEYDSAPEVMMNGFRPQNVNELLLNIKPIVNTEPVGKPWIPIDPYPLFEGSLDDLRSIHESISVMRVRRTTNTKMQLWLDMLRGSGMAPENQSVQVRLFTAHCFLTTLARGVIHALQFPDIQPNVKEILGSGYLAWIVELEEGRAWAKTLLNRINSFEWRFTAGDVLRPLYEKFVDQDDRKDFGEVYTPDWLAEMMVNEVLDEEWCNNSVFAALSELRGRQQADGIGVLDPTCGSGTFLYHCARKILMCEAAKDLQSSQKSDVVCRLVHGIDIHPVAVEFSRATLLRALPSKPSGGTAALSIYQGDALMLRQTDKNTFFDPRDGEILIRSPQGREILIPREFSEHVEFPDMLRRMVDKAAAGEPLPIDINHVLRDDQEKVLACHNTLIEIIADEGNSVWTWYITNILGPERLARRKINRIVANPPWVKLSNIQVTERKRALEAIAGKNNQAGNLGLWIGGKQAPHFDIAQLFIRHTRDSYLNDPLNDPSAWVTKASATRAGNWEAFRDWHKDILAQTIDFSNVKVFGGGDARRSCVLFEVRRSSLNVNGSPKKLAATCNNNMISPHLSWEDAKLLLRFDNQENYPSLPSDYKPEYWRQGATIVPKVLTLANVIRQGRNPDKSIVETTSSNKVPWNIVAPRTREVPVDWLIPVLTSRHLLPFSIKIKDPYEAIIPVDDKGYLLQIEMARGIPFWMELDDLYRERCGKGGNTPKNLIARIDYAGSLSKQLPLRHQRGHLVIYPASGDIMRAAYIRSGKAVLDSKIYWLDVRSATEARYLMTILNASVLEKAFREARTSGRHFHKNPWRSIPIPAFKKENKVHHNLAKLSLRAEKIVNGMDLQSGQIKASIQIRKQLGEDGTMDNINELVSQLLPNHVG
ncbi:MAG: hypothetical protein OXD01_00405 [Gammaproteobacteria bacterium]|nr:hypothetical protein [Gammaproteobacteria bacterium]